MSVHIYGPQFSNFVRSVQWVCEEKGIDYSLGSEVPGLQAEFRGEQHRQWHPYLKVPVLLHQGRALTETAAICRYLDQHFEGPALQPADSWARARCDSWCQMLSLYFDKAIIRDYLLELAFPKGEDGKPNMALLLQNKPAAEQALNLMAAQLAEQPYWLGDQPSLADAIAAPMVCYACDLQGPVALMPALSPLRDYAARLRARPGGAKVLRAAAA